MATVTIRHSIGNYTTNAIPVYYADAIVTNYLAYQIPPGIHDIIFAIPDTVNYRINNMQGNVSLTTEGYYQLFAAGNAVTYPRSYLFETNTVRTIPLPGMDFNQAKEYFHYGWIFGLTVLGLAIMIRFIRNLGGHSTEL